jgi:hypothetical protein
MITQKELKKNDALKSRKLAKIKYKYHKNHE